MRSNFFLTILYLTILLSSSTLIAQWSIGGQGGLIIAKYSLAHQDNETELSTKNGLIIGGLINYKLDEKFNLLYGLRYIQKGGAITHNNINFEGGGKVYIDYLEVPVHLVITPFEIGFNPFLSGGLDFGYLLKAKSEQVINGEERKEDLTSSFNKIDIAVSLGLGLKSQINENSFYILSINYALGVYEVSDQIKTSGLHFLLSILFQI